MDTERCSFVSAPEDKQECMAAISYIEIVLDHDCIDNDSEFCAEYNDTHDFSYYFESLPEQIENDIYEVFMNAFGYDRDEVPTAFDGVVLGNGLTPHAIYCGEVKAADLPAPWGLEGVPFWVEGESAYRPTGWGTTFDVSLDGLAFREGDGIAARTATRLSAAHYFDPAFFVSSGFEFVTTVAENSELFNFDLASEGGYYQAIADHIGFEFFAKLNLGYLMSKAGDVSSFDLGAGGGIRAMIRLLNDPVKSNMPYLSIGAGYLWRLNAGHELLISLGTLFNFM